MSDINERTLQQRLDFMRAQWRALRQAHERRALSPRVALREDNALEDLRRGLEEAMHAFAQASLEWAEGGNEIDFARGDGTTQALVLDRPIEKPDMEELVAELDARIAEFGELPEFKDTTEAIEEMQRLERWTEEETLARMEAWPDRGRVLTIEHIAARARALQEIPSDRLAFVDIGRITVMFGRMAEHLKQGWPGRAHGLARAHSPRSHNWAQDARELYEELSIWRQRAPEFEFLEAGE